MYACYVVKWALTILNTNVNTSVCYEGRLPCANKKKVNYFQYGMPSYKQAVNMTHLFCLGETNVATPRSRTFPISVTGVGRQQRLNSAKLTYMLDEFPSIKTQQVSFSKTFCVVYKRHHTHTTMPTFPYTHLTLLASDNKPSGLIIDCM